MRIFKVLKSQSFIVNIKISIPLFYHINNGIKKSFFALLIDILALT
jgi:hypothetical protein